MRKGWLYFSSFVLSAVAISGCSRGHGEVQAPANSPPVVVTEEPAGTLEPVEPAGAYLFELSSSQYYATENKLYERACFVRNGKLYGAESGKVVGSIAGNIMTAKIYDDYSGATVILKWKKEKGMWQLRNKEKKYSRYRKMLSEGKYLFNVTEYYQAEDSALYYVDYKKEKHDLGVKVFIGDEKWNLGTGDDFNMVSKKDKYGKEFYTDDLVSREG